MRHLTKCLFSAILVLTMLLSILPTGAFAAEQTTYQITQSFVNPMFADVGTADRLTLASPSIVPAPEFHNLQDVVAYMRAQMVNRAETVVFVYLIPASQDFNTALDGLWELISDHNGNPKEGDYLRGHCVKADGGASVIRSGSSWRMTWDFAITYNTTAAQEAELDARLDEVMASLNLEQLNRYEKVKAIYDYICSHVTYDNANLYDDSYTLKYSAYAALVNGTAVCQGYAMLFYRMLLSIGIDNRYISGFSNGGSHGWNIVRLGERYYNADTTWDAPYKKANRAYKYFLRCPATFTGHTRNSQFLTEEFNAAYPMADADFDPAAYHEHSYTPVVTAPTCIEPGFTTFICSCGDSYVQDAAPALGHAFDDGKVTTPPTAEAEGILTFACTRCAATRAESLPKLEAKPFSIARQPEIFVGPIGSTVKFHVEATGVGLTYQWYYSPDGVSWSASGAAGAKTDTLQTSFTASRAGQLYRCEVRNADGEVLTSEAVFMCEALPPITVESQPRSFMGKAGEIGVFSVEASGTGLAYQWYYSKDNGVTWSKSSQPGSTTSTMTVQLTSARAGQCYRCEIRDADGNVLYTEQAAIKLETESIEIKYQPVSCNGYIGDTTSFHVEATGMGLSYQWYYSKNGGQTWSPSGMAGCNTDTLKVQLTEARVGQTYRCIITDNKGNMAYSDVVAMNRKLSVSGIFEIQSQPQDYVGKLGETAVFYVDAIGDTLVYQWQYSKDGKYWSDSSAPGSRTDTLRIEITTARLGQSYRCLITDATGKQLTSTPASMKLS